MGVACSLYCTLTVSNLSAIVAALQPETISRMGLTPAVTFSLLSDRRRRRLLSLLSDRRAVRIDEAVAWIAACEAETTLEEVPTETKRRVRVSLVHVHLPKLADAGVVDYDPRHGDVVLTDRGETLVRTLSALQLETSPPRSDAPD
ncbi:DUF7344 domain-containing protein [Natrialbaceae archaeon AArc-T1-2]|uniref:DUF7344 domain-containing protein n=1 Tax=Natrialbaceae archaeon AArc-T1-2 TaxID=3053904 RepID=UPI00255A8654|nr:hypothetical protein [Natrialbaceae archaeon AArc-T1-2]WIV65646.1 hypothetical protein QQ977_07990 [Natrialbaceae archaeon AArc-T1-2]